MVNIFILVLGLAQAALPPPPQRLSETGLYSDISTKTIHASHLGYSPQYPLWSDGLAKRRWISLPGGSRIESRDFNAWVFPRGTKLWKEFAARDANGDPRRIETRFMEKLTDRRWQYATYIWRTDQSEADLAPNEGMKDFYPIAEGIKHDIPNQNDCMRCHRREGDPVLGVDALQLSADRDPMALPSEPAQPGNITLATLMERNLLTAVPDQVHAAQPRILAANPRERAALGYIHANCGSCHNSRGSDSMTNLSLLYPTLGVAAGQSPATLTTVGRPNQVFFPPGQPDALRIVAGHPERSAFLYRMNRLEPEAHMPPIGSKIIDQRGVELLTEWVRNL